MEKKRLYKKRSKSEYVELTRCALDELFAKEVKTYRVTDISEIVAKKRGEGYDKAGVQSSVSRALVDLIEAEEVIQIDQKYYMPNQIEAVRHIMRDKMVERIEYTREDVFTLSNKMMLIGVTSGSMDAAKRMFREYLGKNCYDILEYSGYLVLLMVWFKKKSDEGKEVAEERNKVLQDIKSIVQEGFNKDKSVRCDKKRKDQVEEVCAQNDTEEEGN